MDTILAMVRHVVIYLLVATLISNLYRGSEYHKYISYTISLIVVVMVLTPLLGLLGRDDQMSDLIIKADYEWQSDQMDKEIQLLGEKYEDTVRTQYIERIKETIATQCDTDCDKCQLVMDGDDISMIKVQVDQMPDHVDTLISSISLCYDVPKTNIYIEEDGT